MRNFLRVFSVLSFLVVAGGAPLRAALNDSIQADAAVLADWFGTQLSNATAFNAAGTLPSAANVHGLLGFEVGVSGDVTATALDSGEFNALPLNDLQTTSIDIPSRLLVPVPLLHFKVGLPGGMDLGAKMGKLDFDKTSGTSRSEYKSRVFGVEVRKQLLGGGVTGVALPQVAASVSLDRATGEVSRTDTYNAPVSTTSIVATNNWNSSWNTGALSARVVVSKKILILTPYLGLGYSKFLGHTDTTVSVVSTGADTNNINAVAVSRKKPKSGVGTVSGGVNLTLLPLVQLGVGGVWSPDDWGAHLGLRVDFR